MTEENVNDGQEVIESAPEASPAGDVQEEPAWVPEYKFSVMDKEYEIPEYVRPVINKDNYNDIRDTYTKAYGLEHAKARAERLEQEYNRVRPFEETAQKQNQALGYLGNLVQNKDYNTLFKELNIQDNDVTNYTLERLKYRELPPEERQEYDQRLQDRQRLGLLERQNQEQSNYIQHVNTQERVNEMEHFLSGPNKSVVEEFDSRVGRQGAFREEVIRRGQLAWYTKGQDISAEQAVNEVMQIYGRPSSNQGNGGNVNGNSYSQSQSKPLIPNIRSGNQSVVRPTIRSIDDLKKLAADRSS